MTKWLGGKDEKDTKDDPKRPHPDQSLPENDPRRHPHPEQLPAETDPKRRGPHPDQSLPNDPRNPREPRNPRAPRINPQTGEPEPEAETQAAEVLVMDQASLRDWRDRVYLGGPSSAEWEEFDLMVPVVEEEAPPPEGGVLEGLGSLSVRKNTAPPPGSFSFSLDRRDTDRREDDDAPSTKPAPTTGRTPERNDDRPAPTHR